MLIILAWLACGFVGSGLFYRHFQSHFPELADHDRRTDLTVALICGITGPCAIFVGIFFTDFARYGWWGWERTPHHPTAEAQRAFQEMAKEATSASAAVSEFTQEATGAREQERQMVERLVRGVRRG